MNKKLIFCLLSCMLFSVWSTDLFAQDIIIKKNGKKVKVVIQEVNDTEIKYTDFNDPDGVLFTMDRALIREIKFSHGTKIKEEGPSQDESYYYDDKRHNIKVNFTAIGAGYTILTYERSIDLKSSIEGSIKLPGLGIQDYGERSSGFGVGLGYKLKLGSLFKKNNYRPKHLLHGWYFRPNVGYTFSKTKDEEGTNDTDVSRSFANFGIDFGIQWILSNRISLDMYTGFHYYTGGITKVERNGVEVAEDSVDYYEDVRGGDIFGNDNRAGVIGFRVGILLDKRKK